MNFIAIFGENNITSYLQKKRMAYDFQNMI